MKPHNLTIALHLKSRTGKSTEAEEMPKETVAFARSFELQMQGEILLWKIYSNSIYRAHECQKKSDTFLCFHLCLLPSFSVSLLHLSFSLYSPPPPPLLAVLCHCCNFFLTESSNDKMSVLQTIPKRKGSVFPRGQEKPWKFTHISSCPTKFFPYV